MNTAALATRDRRALIAGATVIGVLLVCVRGLPAWRSWRSEMRAAAAERLEEAQRAEAILKDLPASLDTLEARTARLRRLPLLTGDTPSDAASNLVAAVVEMARASGVRLEAGQSRYDSATMSLGTATVEARATGDISGLASLLRRLESGTPFLAITHLAVQPRRVDGPPDEIELLTFEFTVRGPALVRGTGVIR